ncbi:MAG: glycosyltransferase family 4 protein [Candidatus Zambryskibacteria bacterium]|nr:glycosyltransferase family 4 protein [Candidatus Zambryskibacteria bacterium]
MKLLIVTQKVNIDDPILGFFHRWIEEFSKKFEKVTVICLEKGKYELPKNVKVLSLGKEQYSQHSNVIRRLVFSFKFYKYIWQERENYDSVFVHMNQEYVLLAGICWRLMGKKVFLWRNHPVGDWKTDLACFLSHKVFHTSPQAFVEHCRNAELMPVGIDLDNFRPSAMPVESNNILVLGRIAPVKRLEYIIDGLGRLHKKRVAFKADIVGDALEADAEYYDSLKARIKLNGLGRKVRLLPAISHEEAPELYRQYKVFINLTPDGSLDKTIFEALASGLKTVVGNTFFKGKLPDGWIVENPEDADHLAHVIKFALNDSHSRNTEGQNRISVLLKENGIKDLIHKMLGYFE